MDRRSFLAGGLTTLVAAPAIVRATSIMPVHNRFQTHTSHPIDEYKMKLWVEWAERVCCPPVTLDGRPVHVMFLTPDYKTALV